MHFLPWWVLMACLAASAVVAYLLVGRTQAGDSPWALFPLTVALAPVIVVGAMATAVVLSTLLFAALDEQPAPPTGPSEPAARTDLRTTSEPTAPATSSPSASPSASASASASP